MTEERNKLAELFADCSKDEALKGRFMRDPKAVLSEHGIEVPADMNVNVIENTDSAVNITLPAAPGGAEGLSDEDLASVAGGGDVSNPPNSISAHECHLVGCCNG